LLKALDCANIGLVQNDLGYSAGVSMTMKRGLYSIDLWQQFMLQFWFALMWTVKPILTSISNYLVD